MNRKQPPKEIVQWRSHEPSRLETFSDAVFAFAITLIILSIEVPRSYTELSLLMKGGIGFAASFFILFSIWNKQNIFFRRYALNDNYTVMLNSLLLFTTLMYVYPLKFLSVLLFSGDSYIENGKQLLRIEMNQQASIIVLFSVGYCILYLLFFLLYKHAERNHHAIGLTHIELYVTKTTSWVFLFKIILGLISIVTAVLLPQHVAGQAGFVYLLIPVVDTIWFSYRGKKTRAM